MFAPLNITALVLSSGHGLIGTSSYGQGTQFDDVELHSSYAVCSGDAASLVAGAPVAIVECSSEVGLRSGSLWAFNTIPGNDKRGTFSLRAAPALCLSVGTNSSGNPGFLSLAACGDHSSPSLQWVWAFDGVSPDDERITSLSNPASGRCLDTLGAHTEIGLQLDAWECNPASVTKWQSFFWDADAGEIANEWSASCVGVC